MTEPANFRVFYHVCCIGNWTNVVDEQARLLAHVGIKEVDAVVLGDMHEVIECSIIAESRGLKLNLVGMSVHHDEGEHIALAEVQRWARKNQDGAALYLHTKGVSSPGSVIKQRWRRMMQAYTVAKWRDNLALLAKGVDAVGVAWQESRDFPHFAGNFWIARGDWLAKLPDIHSYRMRYRRDDPRFAGRPWWTMHCETWIGAEPFCNAHSLCGRNLILWGDDAFLYSADVEGFNYETR